MPTIVIPARYESSRLPGKMLISINDKPMIRHVYDLVCDIGYDIRVVTDSPEIAKQIPRQHVIMSGPANSGTERISNVIDELPKDDIINVQGDMVDIKPSYVHTGMLRRYQLCTLCTGLREDSPSKVKVIHSMGKANWFTRTYFPYADHHIGIYGYHQEPLRKFPYINPHNAEHYENLEQLRWFRSPFEFGIDKIPNNQNVIEINTEEDLNEWRKNEET